MKKLLSYIVTSIVDNPDQVKISESTDDTGLTALSIQVNQEDMGKVIGKGGKVINAIRQVVKIKALRTGKRINVSIEEPEESQNKKEDTDEQT